MAKAKRKASVKKTGLVAIVVIGHDNNGKVMAGLSSKATCSIISREQAIDAVTDNSYEGFTLDKVVEIHGSLNVIGTDVVPVQKITL